MRPLALALLTIALAVAPSAQIDEGVIQAGGSATVALSPDFQLLLSPSVGYFVTPKVEVGANPTVATDFKDTFAYLTAFGAYYPTGGTARATYPFVGASFGASLTDDVGLAIGARAGVQHFVSESAALSVALNALTTEDFDDASVSLNAGFSIFLQP